MARHDNPRMAREKSLYVCNECGGTSTKWLGRCPQCEAWNSLVETAAEAPSRHRYAAGPATALTPSEGVATLADIEAA